MLGPRILRLEESKFSVSLTTYQEPVSRERKIEGRKDEQNKEEGRERRRRENIISLYLPGFGLLKTMDMSITGSNRRKGEARSFIVAVCWFLKAVWIVTS